MSKALLEKDIQRVICDYLFSKGYFFWRSNNTPIFDKGHFRALPKYTPKGLPDIMLLSSGIFYGIEVKRPVGHYVNRTRKPKISEEQEQFGRKLFENGAKYFIVTSLEDLLVFMPFLKDKAEKY